MRLRNQLEGFSEESRIKLSAVGNLFGVGGMKMLQALAEGATDPAGIAALAESSVRATQPQLADALSAATTLIPLRRQILQLFLDRLQIIDQQREALAQSVVQCLREHHESVMRLAQTPG